MLDLGCFVHFSLRRETPLLLDKLTRGYPHALLVFDAARLANTSGACLLSFNTKAWRSRTAMRRYDASDRDGVERLIGLEGRGRLSSLELLVKFAAGLDGLIRVQVFSPDEVALVEALLCAVAMECLPDISLGLVAGVRYCPERLDRIEEYFDACASAGEVLRPPRLPFD
jgi:hypothetical protein